MDTSILHAAPLQQKIPLYSISMTQFGLQWILKAQYFTSLVYLDCSSTLINSCPALPASLKYLDFSHVSPSPGDGFLPVLPEGLLYLVCEGNYIFNLNVDDLPGSLRYLDCSDNAISTLGSLAAMQLDTFICSRQFGLSPYTHVLSRLPQLPASLRYLDCSDNGLGPSLSGLPAGLLYLNCSTQNINTNPEETLQTLFSLTLPPNLEFLNCSYNAITDLPALPASLKIISCSNQYQNNWNGDPRPGLEYTLAFLPALPVSLLALDCHETNITCLPRLPFTLATLTYDRDKVKCLPNSIPAAPNAVICDAATNVNQCNAFPVIKGTVFTDNNVNGVNDSGDFPGRNIKVVLSNGAYTFTDNNGHFALATDSIGSFSVSVVSPPYFTSLPAASSFIFNSYDTAVTTNFGLQAVENIDSVAINITPFSGIARAGSPLVYRITCENAGTTTLSPDVSFFFDDTRLNYDSSSNPLVVNSGGNLSLSLSNLLPGQNSYFDAYSRWI